MKKSLSRILLVLVALPLLAYGVLGVLFLDPTPSIVLTRDLLQSGVDIEQAGLSHGKPGSFKAILRIPAVNKQPFVDTLIGEMIEFGYGDSVMQLRAGVTNHGTSLIQLFRGNQLLVTEEAPLLKKLPKNKDFKVEINFFDQSNQKYEGEARVELRIYTGSGFFGDLGSQQLNLTPYGDFSGHKHLHAYRTPEGSKMEVWKDWASAD
jgi:hypothetical protein